MTGDGHVSEVSPRSAKIKGKMKFIEATHSTVPPSGNKFCKAQTQFRRHCYRYNVYPQKIGEKKENAKERGVLLEKRYLSGFKNSCDLPRSMDPNHHPKEMRCQG